MFIFLPLGGLTDLPGENREERRRAADLLRESREDRGTYRSFWREQGRGERGSY
jgi:hypothetical protein